MSGIATLGWLLVGLVYFNLVLLSLIFWTRLLYMGMLEDAARAKAFDWRKNK